MNRKIKALSLPVLAGTAAWLSLAGLQAASLLPTPGEESRYKEYSQNEAIARFLGRVAFSSPSARVRVVGRTKDAREYPSRDLFLVILSEEGIAVPERLDAAKPTVLITAAQHGNEQSAKEAALRIIRDVALGDLHPLLTKINILVLPQINPYGNSFDRRTNELDLDMNRDHVKVETEGVAAIHRVFRDRMPEATIDVHEKGDDYYRVSIGCVSNLNIDPRFQDYARNTLLADVDRALAQRNIAFHEYLVTEEMGVNTSAGAALRGEDLRDRELMKRYSTTDINDGRNSLGIFQTLSFIQECSSRHDLATLAERTGWQYAGLRCFLDSVAGHADEIRVMVRGSRRALLERAGRPGDLDPVHLKMDYVRDPRVPAITLLKFQNAASSILGVLKTDKKAGQSIAEEDLGDYPWPEKLEVRTEVIKNWFPGVESRLSVERPQGYIIPAAQQAVVETLLRLGLAVQTFSEDSLVEEEVYAVSEVVPAKYDYLPPESLKLEKKTLSVVIKKGDFYVSCVQAGANLIPCLLEPQSDFGLIRYQSFKLVPEKGGFFPIARCGGQGPRPLVPYKDFWR